MTTKDLDMDPKVEHDENELGGDVERQRLLTKTLLFKIIGMEKDLGISNSQYNQGLAIFYATYIASELPSNLVLKKVSPRIWLPFLTCAWGIVTMCLGFVRSYGSFVAVRAVLGMTEGGLLPGMVLYLSGLYTRGELALRIGIFYTAASLSGAFGGLLARGLSAIGPAGGLEGWSSDISGKTVVCGIIAAIGLPNNLATANILTPEEREWAIQRLQVNVEGRFNSANERAEKFRWSEVGRGVFNVQVWLSATAYFAILSGLYSFGLFVSLRRPTLATARFLFFLLANSASLKLPTIINDMHIADNTNQVQLWSVIPYAVATPVTVLVAFLSDRLRLRGLLMLCVLPISIAGYAAIANVTAPQARFAMTCLMAIGMYSAVPCVLVWNSNNSAGHYKRATTSALQLAIANCGGFVATFIYPSSEGPFYHKGHTVILGLLCYAWVATLLNVLWCAKINRDKAAGKYDEHLGSGDDREPSFKMVL
ncbi:putative major facilitator superfamily transporter [Colletotrichum sublineola]|uniref:Putative major facilitator superfamily transporter n=1 Tax=Colletotrichum sublineola TaxID=1173701 RepID=A0A066XJR9_COLSU|nr:putative major facilitator superfamily transporter [Colletotrichum sublineola]